MSRRRRGFTLLEMMVVILVMSTIMMLTVFHCALTMAYESVFPFFARAQLQMTTAKDLFALMGATVENDRPRRPPISVRRVQRFQRDRRSQCS